MKSLFRSFLKGDTTAELQLKEKYSEPKQQGYPKVVQEIHNEFMTAGDRLLQEANSIIASIVIENQDKVSSLKEFGFRNVPEVTKTDIALRDKANKENLAKAITELSKEFPLYKVINGETVQTICKKYNLVLGENRLYKGFVPVKNLKEIEQFFVNHPEEKFRYFESNQNGRYTMELSKKMYEHLKEEEKTKSFNLLSYKSLHKDNVSLYICAPIKDMETEGYRLEGHRLVAHVPDPIVLLPKIVNGMAMYVIITAWGDEASDELVTNAKNN